GGTGLAGSPAVFDYSATFGPDLAANELSAARRLTFSNPRTELFQFTAVVYAHLPDPAYATAATSEGGSSGGESVTSSGTSSGGSGTGPTGTLDTLLTTQPKVLTFTINPLTGKVSLLQ
ncbi:MAG: hypothetical protein ABR603_14720, partial [Pyrinomonadaceae bacterium]